MAHFLELLRKHGIEALADVRSVPFSRHAPQFGLRVLERSLAETGIEYVYLGQELGGRPEVPGYYDQDGHVLYGRLAGSAIFQAGVQQLMELGGERRTAVMCAEEDPAGCHRHVLIGRVLVGQGADVRHIRKDGSIEEPSGQLSLLQDETAWRSTRPVRGLR